MENTCPHIWNRTFPRDKACTICQNILENMLPWKIYTLFIYNTRENRLCLINFTVLYISLQIKCKTFTIVHVWIKVCIYGETHNVWDKIFQSLPIVCMLLSILIIPFFLVLWWKDMFIINNRILCFVLIGCWNGKLNGMEISPKRTLI